MDSVTMSKCIKYAYREHGRWEEKKKREQKRATDRDAPFMDRFSKERLIDVTNKPFEALFSGAELVGLDKASIYVDFDQRGFTETPDGGTCWWMLSTGPKGANRAKEKSIKGTFAAGAREFRRDVMPIAQQVVGAALTSTVATFGGLGSETVKAGMETAQPLVDLGLRTMGLQGETKEDMQMMSKGGSGAKAQFGMARGKVGQEFLFAEFAGGWSAGGVAFFQQGTPPKASSKGYGQNPGDVCLFLAFTKNQLQWGAWRDAQVKEIRQSREVTAWSDWIKETAVDGFGGYGEHATFVVNPVTKKAYLLERYRGSTPRF